MIEEKVGVETSLTESSYLALAGETVAAGGKFGELSKQP
mgnify:CR=1 FL=1